VALLREKGNNITTAMMRTCARLFFWHGEGAVFFLRCGNELRQNQQIPFLLSPSLPVSIAAPRNEKGAEASCFLAFCVV
jgi:hypothetical protein